MTRGSGGSLTLTGWRTFTSDHLPAYPGALDVPFIFFSDIDNSHGNAQSPPSWEGCKQSSLRSILLKQMRKEIKL